MTTKEFLQLYSGTEALLQEMQNEIERLRSKAEQITPPYGGDGGSNPNVNADKIPAIVEMIIAEEERTKEEREHIAEVRADVQEAIFAVKDNTFQTLLYLRYITGRTWEQIAIIMHYSYVHVVHRLHPDALRAVKIPEKYENM